MICPLSVLFIFFSSSQRTADHNVTSPTSTAQHRASSTAQVVLANIESLIAPNHGPFLSATIAFSCILPCASVAGGVSRPRSGVLGSILFLCISSIIFALVLCPSPSLHVTQTRGHSAGSSFPLPTTARAFVFIDRITQRFLPSSTPVELLFLSSWHQAINSDSPPVTLAPPFLPSHTLNTDYFYVGASSLWRCRQKRRAFFSVVRFYVKYIPHVGQRIPC